MQNYFKFFLKKVCRYNNYSYICRVETNKKLEIMKIIQVKYNKVATVIETVGNVARVFTFKNKKQFFAYISKVEACSIVVSQAINKVVKTMESLDFEVIIDESYGFDYEVKLYCNYDPS